VLGLCFFVVKYSFGIQFYQVCTDSGQCDWINNVRYDGCMAMDIQGLHFVYFDESSSLDLRCTDVTVVTINDGISCRDMKNSKLVITNKVVEVLLGDETCVSISCCIRRSTFFFNN
jgi:hypothetical protein